MQKGDCAKKLAKGNDNGKHNKTYPVPGCGRVTPPCCEAGQIKWGTDKDNVIKAWGFNAPGDECKPRLSVLATPIHSVNNLPFIRLGERVRKLSLVSRSDKVKVLLQVGPEIFPILRWKHLTPARTFKFITWKVVLLWRNLVECRNSFDDLAKDWLGTMQESIELGRD